MSCFVRLRCVFFVCLGMAVLVAGWPSSLGAYTQANLQTAADGSIETIPLEATVQMSPAQISIKTLTELPDQQREDVIIPRFIEKRPVSQP